MVALSRHSSLKVFLVGIEPNPGPRKSNTGRIQDKITVQGHGIGMSAFSLTGSANVLVPVGGSSPVTNTIFTLSDIWSDSHLFGLAQLHSQWRLNWLRIEYIAHFGAVFSGTTSSDPGSFVIGIDGDPANAITVTYSRIACLPSAVIMPGCVTARRPTITYRPPNREWLATTRVGETTAASVRLTGFGRLYAQWAVSQTVGLGSVGDFHITYSVDFKGPTYTYTVNQALTHESNLGVKNDREDSSDSIIERIPLNGSAE